MATTSGQYNTMTVIAQDAITQSMKKLRVLAGGGTANTNDLTDGTFELNNLLKYWETKGWLLWLADLVGVPMVQNKYRYTIGPNADVDPGYRPLRIREGSFIRTTCTSSPFDTQVQILSRIEYMQFANKPVQGIPNSVYYDPQQGPGPNPVNYNPYSQGWGVLYVFPNPADNTRTIFLDTHRPVQDITAVGQTFDLPVEWYQALIRCLMVELADYFEVPEDRLGRLIRQKEQAEEYIANWGVQEWAPMWFTPDFQQGMYRGGR
jgi:hypothetical protein